MRRLLDRPNGLVLIALLGLLVPLACDLAPNPSPSASAPAPSQAGPSASASVATEPPLAAAAWAAVTPSEPGPPARSFASWAVDPSSAVGYLFGGSTDAGELDDLWAYDLTADAWRPLTPSATRPPARSDHVAGWVEGHGVVVFGGEGDGGTLGDLWSYDPAADAWTELETEGARPEARSGACAAVGADGRLWIYGGRSSGGDFLGDVWVLEADPARWTTVTPSDPAPTPRADASCWWTDDGSLAIYGGLSADEPALRDVWRIEGPESPDPAWRRAPDAPGSPRSAATAVRSAIALVAVGGVGDDGQLLDDVVVFDPRSLAATVFGRAPDGPAARAGSVVVDDPEGERLVMFGGRGDDGSLDDVWALDVP